MSTFFGDALQPWLAALKAGEVVAAPAEGVYGYCADPFNSAALAKLMQIKQRNSNKGVITLIGEPSQLQQFCPQPLSEECEEAIARNWPCPQNQAITLILPVRQDVPILLRGGHPTIAIRCPATPYMQEYLQAWGGPLVSTSLNITGEPPATRLDQLSPDVISLTLPQPLSGKASSIFNPLTGEWYR